MYEGGIKVPACMVWEGTVKAGSVSDKFGLTMDFYPTICSIAGTTVLHTIDGIDLLPGLFGKGEDGENHRIVYFMRREGVFTVVYVIMRPVKEPSSWYKTPHLKRFNCLI